MAVDLVCHYIRTMRFAGEIQPSKELNPLLAESYEDRLRHRQEAKILYEMIMRGELGDPSTYSDTLKQLQNQISGIEVKGV